MPVSGHENIAQLRGDLTHRKEKFPLDFFPEVCAYVCAYLCLCVGGLVCERVGVHVHVCLWLLSLYVAVLLVV